MNTSSSSLSTSPSSPSEDPSSSSSPEDSSSSSFIVDSPSVIYTSNTILSLYEYNQSIIINNRIKPIKKQLLFKTKVNIPKVGIMLVGWGGNNGSTITASIIANKLLLKWNTKEGIKVSNYYGSLTQSSTVRLGEDQYGRTIYIPFNQMLPMISPNDLEISGWDINSANIAEAMERSQVNINIYLCLYLFIINYFNYFSFLIKHNIILGFRLWFTKTSKRTFSWFKTITKYLLSWIYCSKSKW